MIGPRVDRSAQAFHRAAIHRVGSPVQFQRLSGAGVNVVTRSVDAIAALRDALPNTTAPAETGYGASSPDAISQSDRTLVVMDDELREKGFPMPLAKDDKVLLADTGDLTTITRVDAAKRRLAGAIEVTITGTG